MAEYNNQEEQYEILYDVTESGKDRNWKGRKERNIELGNRYGNLGYEKLSSTVLQCAEVLKFQEQESGRLRLYQSWFCKNKLCPICNWRRALKHSYQSGLIIDEALKQYPSARFVFLTLTVKNVPAEELNKTVTDMTKAFNALMHRKKVVQNHIGFLRATEVTYNKRRDDYHPHLHVLLMVKSTYFRDKDNYVTHTEWQEYWQQSAKLDYEPVVNVKAVKAKLDDEGNEIGIEKAIRETAKYPVKPFDVGVNRDGKPIYLTEAQKEKVTKALYEGLFKKRQIAYGGLLKTIKKELELDDTEDGDLIEVGDEESSKITGKQVVAKWDWRRKNYFIR